MNSIYLDHAAATPLDPSVLTAMQPFFSEQFYNPSATYQEGKLLRKSLDTARTQVAHWLGVRGSEIIFTAGGTEANNLAVHGVMRQFPGRNIVVSSIEHESVLVPSREYDCREVSVHPDGRLDIDDLKSKIDENTVMISVMYANNEVGTVQPIREIARLVQGLRKGRELPLYFHIDACQAANYLDLHVSRLGADFMTLNGGKIYGPKQSGVLYVKAGTPLLPLISGGGQERGLRSGTENVAAAIGFAEALEQAQTIRQAETERLASLQTHFIHQLQRQISTVMINGSTKFRLANNVHITLDGQDNERLLIQLEQKGILAAAGSACSASSDVPSHVLRAMGLSESDARSSLRFTLGRGTSMQQIDYVVSELSKLVA